MYHCLPYLPRVASGSSLTLDLPVHPHVPVESDMFYIRGLLLERFFLSFAPIVSTVADLMYSLARLCHRPHVELLIVFLVLEYLAVALLYSSLCRVFPSEEHSADRVDLNYAHLLGLDLFRLRFVHCCVPPSEVAPSEEGFARRVDSNCARLLGSDSTCLRFVHCLPLKWLFIHCCCGFAVSSCQSSLR